MAVYTVHSRLYKRWATLPVSHAVPVTFSKFTVLCVHCVTQTSIANSLVSNHGEDVYLKVKMKKRKCF